MDYNKIYEAIAQQLHENEKSNAATLKKLQAESEQLESHLEDIEVSRVHKNKLAENKRNHTEQDASNYLTSTVNQAKQKLQRIRNAEQSADQVINVRLASVSMGEIQKAKRKYNDKPDDYHTLLTEAVDDISKFEQHLSWRAKDLIEFWEKQRTRRGLLSRLAVVGIIVLIVGTILAVSTFNVQQEELAQQATVTQSYLNLIATQDQIDNWATLRSEMIEGFLTDSELVNWEPLTQEFDGVEMVFVPAGCFVANAPDSSAPQQVCLNSFWIDQYEVHRSNNHIIVGVSADLAQDSCADRGTRLPTEYEWMYAASGPSSLKYPWGDSFDKTLAHVEKTSRSPGNYYADGQSWVGAYNMIGNVWEWVFTDNDTHVIKGFGHRDSINNPSGPAKLSDGIYAGLEFDSRDATIGYRCLKDADDSVEEVIATQTYMPLATETAQAMATQLHVPTQTAESLVYATQTQVPILTESAIVQMTDTMTPMQTATAIAISEEVIGELTWTIRDENTGRILDSGTNIILYKDIILRGKVGWAQPSSYSVYIPLNSEFGFRIGFSDIESGFSMWFDNKSISAFGFNYFSKGNRDIATNVDNSGQVSFDRFQVHSFVGISSLEFDSVTKLVARRYDDGDDDNDWSVTIGSGSYLDWSMFTPNEITDKSSIDLSGHWVGDLSQATNNEETKYFNYTMTLSQTGNKITGTTRIEELLEPDIYGEITMEGTLQEDRLIFEDIEVTSENLRSGFWCMKGVEMYVEFFNGSPILNGTWSAPGRGCNNGYVFVEKQN